MSTGNRWFPGPESEQKFEPGWALSSGEGWDAESASADLTSFHLRPPRTLVLEFYSQDEGSLTVEFTDLKDLQIDGNLEWEGEAPIGWEVLGTSMLAAERPRADSLVVYMLQLPQALMCFAAAEGVARRT